MHCVRQSISRLVDQSKIKIINFIMIIFKSKILNIVWFQLHKCLLVLDCRSLWILGNCDEHFIHFAISENISIQINVKI